MTEMEPAVFECPVCGGEGETAAGVCEACDGGDFEVSQCPREFLGLDMIESINIAGSCSNGYMPVEGGLMDQSAWFISLWQALNSDQAKIQQEQIDRKLNRE